MTHKRKREQEEDEKDEAEVEAAAAIRSKKAKEDKEAASSDGGGIKGKNKISSSKVKAFEQKQEDLQGKMDKLSEKKSEMIWLLKQVIKQEALQKLKKMKKKTEAK